MDNDIIDISMDFDNFGKSKGNFGGGIELLMNDNKSSSHRLTSDIDIDDLNNLENELNGLANDTAPITNTFESNLFESNLFGVKNNYNDNSSVRFNEEPAIHIFNDKNNNNLGQSTANTSSESKTWDGYGKFNNIPINPDQRMYSEPKLSKDETLKEKFKYLRMLEALEKKGIELTKKYNIDSNLQEMMGEYEMIKEENSKKASVKLQRTVMMTVINGIEFLNNRFDPFDVNIDGWGEQINENITDYDDVFAELYEKYKSKATLSPELKLLFQLGGSAMMVYMSNTIFKSAMPGMDDILRQNPDLMRQFQSAAVNSMAGSNPGFSGFMGGLMEEPKIPSGSRNRPPPPMSTQGPNGMPPPPNRAGNNNGSMNVGRADISMARGAFSQGATDDGISIRENNIGISGFEPPKHLQKSSRRPDMKGPVDISDILSGLKTKTIDISTAPSFFQQQQQQQNKDIIIEDINNNSTISIDDLKSIQNDGNIPKRSRRRPKSDKNTVSLDI